MKMFYTLNGNILSKTGIGTYEYSSNGKPHAVAAVDNTADLIPVDGLKRSQTVGQESILINIMEEKEMTPIKIAKTSLIYIVFVLEQNPSI